MSASTRRRSSSACSGVAPKAQASGTSMGNRGWWVRASDQYAAISAVLTAREYSLEIRAVAATSRDRLASAPRAGGSLPQLRSALPVPAQRRLLDGEPLCGAAQVLLPGHVEAPLPERPAQSQEHPQGPTQIASVRPGEGPALGGELVAAVLVVLPLSLRRAMPVAVVLQPEADGRPRQIDVPHLCGLLVAHREVRHGLREPRGHKDQAHHGLPR